VSSRSLEADCTLPYPVHFTLQVDGQPATLISLVCGVK